MRLPIGVYVLSIPGEATRRSYAVYLLLAKHRGSGRTTKVYVGKVGDNREGCNPIISRIGNHMSFNKLHSQARNRIARPEKFDFQVFYGFFGRYRPPRESRAGIDLINEMERQLNKRAQEAFGRRVSNPMQGTRSMDRLEERRRGRFLTRARAGILDAIIESARTTITRGQRTLRKKRQQGPAKP